VCFAKSIFVPDGSQHDSEEVLLDLLPLRSESSLSEPGENEMVLKFGFRVSKGLETSERDTSKVIDFGAFSFCKEVNCGQKRQYQEDVGNKGVLLS
jgi:hypothetical protein